jgi:multicomponent Na+:H+ antiporter subunit C
MPLFTAIAIGVMFGIGVFQLLRRNVIRAALGFIILSNAVNLFLLSMGAYDGVAAAYVTATGQHSDALPQALVLTAIVISMGGLALVLAVLHVIAIRYQTGDGDKIDRLKY